MVISFQTGKTLQSIKSIASFQGIDESEVRFNKFTGKAIVMGSSGSIFGLVSWVRRLYTTSSDKKIDKFLVCGLNQQYGTAIMVCIHNEFKGKGLHMRTVRELKIWHETYEEIIGRGTNIRETNVDPNGGGLKSDKNRVLDEVKLMVKPLCEEPESFVNGVEGPSLINCLSGEDRRRLRKAGLKSMRGSLGEGVSSELEVMVESSGFKGYFAKQEKIKDFARGICCYYLNDKLSCLFKKCAKDVGEASLDKIEDKVSLLGKSGIGDGYVKLLFDSHYGTGDWEDTYRTVIRDKDVREKAEAKLKNMYVEHNSNITKTIYVEPLISAGIYGGEQEVNIEGRKKALNKKLFFVMDNILKDYEVGGFLLRA